MKEQLMNVVGEFTWDFGQNFFIETPIGNFVWSDPDYYGDNTIRTFNGSIQDYFGEGFGRCKGRHTISGYCGEDFEFVAGESK